MLNFNGLMLNNNVLYLADYVVHRNLNLDDGWAEIYTMKNSDEKPDILYTEILDWHAEQLYPTKTDVRQNFVNHYSTWVSTVYSDKVNIEIPNLEDLTYMMVSVQHLPHSVGRNTNPSNGMNRLQTYFSFPGADYMWFGNNSTTNTATTYNEYGTSKTLAQGANYTFSCNNESASFVNSAAISSISSQRTTTTYKPSLTTLLIKNNGNSCDYSAYHQGSDWEPGNTNQTFVCSGTKNTSLRYHDTYGLSVINSQQYEPGSDTWCWAGYMFPKISISACYSALDENKLNELMNVMYYD